MIQVIMTKVKPLNKWDRYWRLTVLWEYESREVWHKWEHHRFEKCLCDCWNECRADKQSLKCWHKKSCWCLWQENLVEISMSWLTHWMRWTRIYRIYYDIKSRCNNEKNSHFEYYWWRWIKCLWNTFEDFYNDMWEDYERCAKEFWEENTSIDRIDNNWDYCKDNCRWANKTTQARNTRRNKYFDYNWEKLTVPELYEKYKPAVKYSTFEYRLYVYWWTVEKALLPKM